MGKGIAKRRRQQRAQRANSSNLLKAQFGKALPFAPLPDAPKENELKAEKIPASLRKLMQLQEAAMKQEARKQARQEKQEHAAAREAAQQHQPFQQITGQTDEPASTDTIPNKNQQLHAAQRQQQHESTGNTPQTEQQEQPAHTDEPRKQQRQQQRQQQQKMGKVPKDAGKPQIEERIYKEGAFDQAKPKRLKDKKREFLERKKQRKKSGKGALDASSLTPAEMKLKLQQAESEAKFGEVADAPLKVQLKRKHWAAQQQAHQQQPTEGPGPSAPSERLSKIFKAQLATAEQRMQTSPRLQEGQGSKHGGAKPASKKQERVQEYDAQPRVGLLQQARQQAAAAAAAVERDRLRQQVMAAYRQNKQGDNAGRASMKTLAALVKKNAVAAAATAAQLH